MGVGLLDRIGNGWYMDGRSAKVFFIISSDMASPTPETPPHFVVPVRMACFRQKPTRSTFVNLVARACQGSGSMQDVAGQAATVFITRSHNQRCKCTSVHEGAICRHGSLKRGRHFTSLQCY